MGGKGYTNAHDRIFGDIAKLGRDFDLVVIGAAKEPFFKQMLFGCV